MRYPDGGGLTALVKTRLRRMQYQPGLLDGFIAGTRLDLTPFRNPRNCGSLVALGPDRALVGPDDALVAAQAEGVADRVSVDPPAVAVGADEVLLKRRAEVEDAALLGLDLVHFEVEVELLGVLAVGPLRSAVVVHPDEGQLDLAELDAGPVLVAAFLDRAARHLRVEGRQLHRVRAVDDEIGESQHPQSCHKIKEV